MRKVLSLFILIFALIVLIACQSDDSSIDFDELYAKNDIYYQIFVRSFADSDGDGIGDLNGITENLDYLEGLGVTALWLLPIHPSDSNHGYRVQDFYDINPEYGTMEDFENLIDEANKRNIKIVLDLVINHVSDTHPWYVDASSDINSQYRDYFIWQSQNHAFESFVGGMKDLNLENPDVVAEVYEIVDFYLEKGVHGFRLDAAKHFFEKPHILAARRQNMTILFLNALTHHMQEKYPDAFLVGEIFEYDYNFFSGYYLGIDSLFNFYQAQLTWQAVGAHQSRNNLIRNLERSYDSFRTQNPHFIDSPFLSNHDIDRIASRQEFQGDTGLLKLAQAARLLLTLPGSPHIYYGDELAMKGFRYEGVDFGQGPVWDEYRRQPFLWGDTSKNTTWLVSDSSNDDTQSVNEAVADEKSLYHIYQTFNYLRRDNPALMYGNHFESWSQNTNTLQGYIRTFTHDNYTQSVLVIHNLSNQMQSVAPTYTSILYGSLDIPPFGTLVVEI